MSSSSQSEKYGLGAAGEARSKASSPGARGEAPEAEGHDHGLVPNKPRLRAPYHYGAYVFIAVFLVWWDPFHWGEASSNASQDLAYRVLIGPLYPTDHRDDITVVLFNESTLGYLGATWPVTLGTHAEILRNIREMGPRAVMVDFIFPDERDDPSVAALKDEIRAYAKEGDAGIPLYFGRAEGTGLGWIRPDLSEATLASITNPIDDGVSRTYEPCSKASAEAPACACVSDLNTFESCGPDVDAASAESRIALTASFELYSEKADLPDRLNIHDPEPMDVVWSNRLNPTNDRWMLKRTGNGYEHLCVNIASSFDDWLRRMLLKSEEYSFRQTCPYSTTVSAKMILSAPQDPALRDLVDDRFVFYGADLAGLEDTVVPPTHVKLPGVYLHAMALDNLLTFDGEYKHSSVPLFGGDMGAGNLTFLVAIVIAVVVVVFARCEPVMRADRISTGKARGLLYFRILWRRWRYWLLFNWCAFVVIVAICWALYSWGGLSPKNWLGYWGLMTALSAMAKGRFAEGVATTISERFVPALGPVVFKEERT